MLDVGAQPKPGFELVRQGCSFVGGARGHRRQIGVPRDSGRPEVCQRHPVWAQHTDVATGQRHVLELRQPLEALVVGEQHLATPHRAVGAVTRSVEGESEHLLGTIQAVFGHHRRDMRVVVLHGSDRSACGVAVRPRGGPVQRMCVGDKHLRCDRGQLLQVPLCRVERGQRREVVHVADVLAQPGVLPVRDRHGVLQVGADGQRRRHRHRQARWAAARIRASAGSAVRRPPTTRIDGVVARHQDRAVVHQPAVGEVRKPFERIVVGETDRLTARFPEVITSASVRAHRRATRTAARAAGCRRA